MYLKKFNLKNKTALVTGAGKGIGKACAIALAEAGADLIIISRTKKDLDKVSKIIKKFKSKCKYFVCDVTNYHQIKEIINRQKKIDILVNNAGVIVRKPAEDITEEEWNHVLDVNLKGPFICSCTVAKRLILDPAFRQSDTTISTRVVQQDINRRPLQLSSHLVDRPMIGYIQRMYARTRESLHQGEEPR